MHVRKKFNDSNWDVQNCTYIHVISLQNGHEFTGYSKKVAYPEKNDKQAVLTNWILRMFDAGYYDINHHDSRRRINHIDYFLNKSPQKCHILTLNYQYYEVRNTAWSLDNPDVFKFLDKFYEILKSGKTHNIRSLYNHKKTTYTDPFDMSKRRWATEKSLREYCHRMIDEKQFTKEQAIGYHQKYVEKYFYK